MTGPARHADRPAASAGAARSLDCMLERGIHHGRSAGAKQFHCDAKATLRADLSSHAPQQILQPLDHASVIITNLEEHLRAPRYDARRTGIERNAAGRPDRAWSASYREPVL